MELQLNWKHSVPYEIYATIDSYKISQVIRNLVSNALKFSPPREQVSITAEFIPASRRNSMIMMRGGGGSFLQRAWSSSTKLLSSSSRKQRANSMVVRRNNNIRGNSVIVEGDEEEQEEGRGSFHSRVGSSYGNGLFQAFRDLDKSLPANLLLANYHDDDAEIEKKKGLPGSSLTELGPHNYSVDMIRIAVTDFGVGLSKVSDFLFFAVVF